jgi:hypothetical protein
VERDQEARDLARDAMSRIEKHEAVCTERYLRIIENQASGASDRVTMHEANQGSIRRIYALLWKCAVGIIAFQAAILAGIVFHH